MSFATRNILVPIASFAAFFAATLLLWWAYLFAPFALVLAALVLLYMRVSQASAAAGLLGIGCAASLWIEPAPMPVAYAILLFAPGVVCAAETLKRGMRLSECVFLTAAAFMGGSLAALGLMCGVSGGVDFAAQGLIGACMRMLALLTPTYEATMLEAFNNAFDVYGMAHLATFEECVSLMSDALKMAIPQSLLTFSAVGGLIAVTVPRAVFLRRGWDTGLARFTPIRQWIVPRHVLFGTGALYLIFLITRLMTGSGATLMLYNAAMGLMIAVYALMGAVTLDRWMYKRGWTPGMRMLIVLALYMTMRLPLCVIVLIDSIKNMFAKKDISRKKEDNS